MCCSLINLRCIFLNTLLIVLVKSLGYLIEIYKVKIFLIVCTYPIHFYLSIRVLLWESLQFFNPKITKKLRYLQELKVDLFSWCFVNDNWHSNSEVPKHFCVMDPLPYFFVFRGPPIYLRKRTSIIFYYRRRTFFIEYKFFFRDVDPLQASWTSRCPYGPLWETLL